jgi:hypothetical protein
MLTVLAAAKPAKLSEAIPMAAYRSTDVLIIVWSFHLMYAGL